MSTEIGTPRIRILAYIERCYGPQDKTQQPGPGIPETFWGHFLDVSLEVESGPGDDRNCALVQHYGDGNLYDTFQEAQSKVLERTGIYMEVIPEAEWPPVKDGRQRVSIFVGEFLLSDKSRADVENDSPYVKFARDRQGQARRETKLFLLGSDRVN